MDELIRLYDAWDTARHQATQASGEAMIVGTDEYHMRAVEKKNVQLELSARLRGMCAEKGIPFEEVKEVVRQREAAREIPF